MEIVKPPIKTRLQTIEDIDGYLEQVAYYLEYLANKLLEISGGKLGVRFIEFEEQTEAPDTPATNRVRVYAKDSGATLNQLVMKCDSGNVIEIAVDT